MGSKLLSLLGSNPKIVYRLKYRMTYNHTHILLVNPLEILGIIMINQVSNISFKIDINIGIKA